MINTSLPELSLAIYMTIVDDWGMAQAADLVSKLDLDDPDWLYSGEYAFESEVAYFTDEGELLEENPLLDEEEIYYQ